MSRSRVWEHTWTWDSEDERLNVYAYWDQFFYDCPLPVKYVPSGGCSPEGACVVLYATKAKARRLAVYLDEFFGRPGKLALLDLERS